MKQLQSKTSETSQSGSSHSSSNSTSKNSFSSPNEAHTLSRTSASANLLVIRHFRAKKTQEVSHDLRRNHAFDKFNMAGLTRKTNISFMVVYCSQNVSLLTRPFGFSKMFNDMPLSSFSVWVISDTNFVKQDVLSTSS